MYRYLSILILLIILCGLADAQPFAPYSTYRINADSAKALTNGRDWRFIDTVIFDNFTKWKYLSAHPSSIVGYGEEYAYLDSHLYWKTNLGTWRLDTNWTSVFHDSLLNYVKLVVLNDTLTKYITKLVANDSLSHKVNYADSIWKYATRYDLTLKADKSTTLTAGDGLSGGGDLSANRSFNVNVNEGIKISSDSVGIQLASNSGLLIKQGSGNIDSLLADTTNSVKKIYGTPNQVNVSNNVGTVILSTPQDIATTSDAIFKTESQDTLKPKNWGSPVIIKGGSLPESTFNKGLDVQSSDGRTIFSAISDSTNLGLSGSRFPLFNHTPRFYVTDRFWVEGGNYFDEETGITKAYTQKYLDTLTAQATRGDTIISVSNANASIHQGTSLMFGSPYDADFEQREVYHVAGLSIRLDAPLRFTHASGSQIQANYWRASLFPVFTLWSPGGRFVLGAELTASQASTASHVQTFEQAPHVRHFDLFNTNFSNQVIYGGTVNATSPASMNLTADSGAGKISQLDLYHYNTGYTYKATAQTVTISTADPSNPRWDLIYWDSVGVVRVSTGTPAGSPSLPSTPTGAIALAKIVVGTGVTSISSGNITDLRPTTLTTAGSFTVTGTATIGTLTGLLKGASGVVSAATAGSDYENPLTFSTGLTRTVNTITDNLATGVSGGQSVIGGTASGNSLTLSSTTNGTKGFILFGTSAYDENNNRLGIGTATPSSQFHFVGTAVSGATRATIEGSTAGSNSPLALYENASVSTGNKVGLLFRMNRADGTAQNYARISAKQMDTGNRISGMLMFATGNAAQGADAGVTIKAVLDSTGNFGIGDTTPTALLTVGDGDKFLVNSSGIISGYGGVATVKNGVGSICAASNDTGQSANISATTLYAVPASGAGTYRISATMELTTAASISSTLPTLQIVFTSGQTSTVITVNATPSLGGVGLGSTGALTSNTVGLFQTGDISIDAKASTNIQYQTTGYASSLAGMKYAVRIKLEYLGAQ